MKIPDGNKPIRVGDPSFIYKGVYHPITWIGEEPYRPRVEMLVIKDARYIFLRLKDDIENTPPDKRNYKYRIPGGSLDADSTKYDQAIAETNEEALVGVALVYNSGISYYDRYEPGFLLKGGDMPLEYVGSITDVFIGVYDGPYDKSKIEEKDLDDDMAENGKFYEISKVGKYLRKEHINALINSQFIANDVKSILQLCRMDVINENAKSDSPIVVPDKLYHGTLYEIDKFRPMSIDLGNAFQEPGWSTFCFSDSEYAKLFGASRAFTAMLKNANQHNDYKGGCPDEEAKVLFVNGHLVMSKQCFELAKEYNLLDKEVTFYVYTIDASNVTVGLGNDPSLKEYTFRDSEVSFDSRDTYNLSMMNLKELIEITDKPINELVPSNYNEYSNYLIHDYQKEKEVRDKLEDAKAKGELQPGDDIPDYMDKNNLNFMSDDIHLPDLSIDIDEPVLETQLGDFSKAIMEEKYPKDVYGLPDRKAYPMPDEKHVRSAIRFFNYAKKEEEKELATNINKKIRKFKIKDINVGKTNRFKQYYQPITESFTFNDYNDALSEIMKKLNNTDDIHTKYDLMEKSKCIYRMLLRQLENGDFDNCMSNITGDGTHTGVVNDGFDSPQQCLMHAIYAGIAECQSNQMEYMAQMEASEIRTLNLKSVMEADDDDEEETETATDYTAMADEAGAEDDDNEAEPDEATGGEGATDYTAMADEAGAEDDNDSGETGDDDSDNTEDTSDDDEPTEDTVDDPEPEETGDDTTEELTGDDTGEEPTEDEATDYTAMADEAGAEDDNDSGEDMGDTSSDTDTTSDDTSTDDTSSEDGGEDENDKRYNNREVKNYFLLNSYLSMHQTVLDVLDTVNGVVLPTPDANSIMAQVVKNLQSVKTFIEKFIQFHFSDTDYAFNLYYYNILMNALRMNLKLLETAVAVGGEDAKIKNKEGGIKT